MSWTASGLYAATIRDMLGNIIAGDWRLTTSKIALHNNSDTPDFSVDPGTWTNANEVSGTGWAAGGVLVSAGASGSASMAPTITQSPSKTVMADATDLSVALTTLTNAYGCKWYMDALSPKAAVVAIYFGGRRIRRRRGRSRSRSTRSACGRSSAPHDLMSPVHTTAVAHFTPGGPASGPPPGSPQAPTSVTPVTKDAAATVSFYAPADVGSGPLTHYVVTPRIGGVAQAATTVTVAAAGSIVNSAGVTARQVPVTGLVNGRRTRSPSVPATPTATARSRCRGVGTPLAGLVFGDDFNGPAGAAPDPEWFVYNRCGFLAQNEIEWYLPSQCVLDGSGNLALTGVHSSHTGPSYPSDGNTVRTQTWMSGGCQSNTRFRAGGGREHDDVRVAVPDLPWDRRRDVAGSAVAGRHRLSHGVED